MKKIKEPDELTKKKRELLELKKHNKDDEELKELDEQIKEEKQKNKKTFILLRPFKAFFRFLNQYGFE